MKRRAALQPVSVLRPAEWSLCQPRPDSLGWRDQFARVCVQPVGLGRPSRTGKDGKSRPISRTKARLHKSRPPRHNVTRFSRRT